MTENTHDAAASIIVCDSQIGISIDTPGWIADTVNQ
jgi:hypothetical protein